jgi:hypothetical protein
LFPLFWVSPSLSFPQVLVSLPVMHGFFFSPAVLCFSFLPSVAFSSPLARLPSPGFYKARDNPRWW